MSVEKLASQLLSAPDDDEGAETTAAPRSGKTTGGGVVMSFIANVKVFKNGHIEIEPTQGA